MDFGKLRLDLPDFGHDGLTICRNVYPATIGYKPFKGLSAATGALAAEWVGGGAFEYNGTSVMLGATAAHLYSHAGGVWTDEKTVATSQPWFFLQFGDLAIGMNGGAPVKYTISTGAAADLGGTPPSASFGDVVRDFVMTAGDGSNAQTVSWSAINDAEGWTFGTDQSDQQEIPDGGPITGISGGEYGLVFQRDAIHVFEYVGVPFIFTRRKVTDQLGALAHGSIGRAGNLRFFLARRGFQMMNGLEDPQPIGRNSVDRAFLENYTTSDIEASMRCAVDPERYLVIWSMPDKLWIYHWIEDKWSTAEVPGLVGISSGVTASATLDDIATIYPSIEDVTPVLDDAFWRGGIPLLLLFKSDKIGYTFSSGANLEATVRMAKMEPSPAKTSHIHNTRVITDATSGITVSMDTQYRLGDVATTVNSTDLRASGEVPIRASGQYIQMQVTLATGTTWTYLQGIEIDGTPGGRL